MGKKKFEVILAETKHFQADSFDWLFLEEEKQMALYIRCFHPNVLHNQYLITFNNITYYQFQEFDLIRESKELILEGKQGLLFHRNKENSIQYNEYYLTISISNKSSLRINAESFILHVTAP